MVDVTSKPVDVDSPAPTRRERKRARTRTELVAATRGLIVEKGVAGLRIDQITERADVALGSFYNHFDSKDDVVEAVVEEAIAALVEAITARSTRLPDPEEAAVVPLRRFVRLAYDDPQLAGLLVNLERADAIFEHAVLPFAVRELERGIREGRFEIPDVGIAVTAVIGGALAIMRRILSGQLPADADIVHAESVLRSFGIDGARAHEVATRPLPDFEPPG
jgi:AcrR family transcriptional regulator